MYNFPIGVMIESFRTDMKTALAKTAKMGAKGIQVHAVKGDMTPEMLTPEKRKEFLKMVKDHGLVISALCGDLDCGFIYTEKNPILIEKSKRILDLAMDLETDIVTTHIGVVPADKNHPRYAIMQDACGQLAEYADSLNAHFAIETGPEFAVTLRGFLDGLHSTGVAINMDPANYVMVTKDDPVQAVHTLKDYIVHTHAKDGRNLIQCDPEVIYGMVESEMLQSKAFIELPLGEGDVDFPNYLKALEDIGYRGFLTIEREVGQDPEKDIILAKDFLVNLMK